MLNVKMALYAALSLLGAALMKSTSAAHNDVLGSIPSEHKRNRKIHFATSVRVMWISESITGIHLTYSNEPTIFSKSSRKSEKKRLKSIMLVDRESHRMFSPPPNRRSLSSNDAVHRRWNAIDLPGSTQMPPEDENAALHSCLSSLWNLISNSGVIGYLSVITGFCCSFCSAQFNS